VRFDPVVGVKHLSFLLSKPSEFTRVGKWCFPVRGYPLGFGDLYLRQGIDCQNDRTAG
jgi:hypothetical protein